MKEDQDGGMIWAVWKYDTAGSMRMSEMEDGTWRIEIGERWATDHQAQH